MMRSGAFWTGVVVGVVAVYGYHRVKGLPGKAGG